MPLKQEKTSSVKQVDKIYAHNKIVFYSCNRELRIDLAHDATVGERCRKLKFFLRFHQDPSMSSSKQRVEGVSLHLHTTCRSRAEACKVMMESYSNVIRITDDQVLNGQHLRVQHTYGTGDVSSFLIQQGGRRG